MIELIVAFMLSVPAQATSSEAVAVAVSRSRSTHGQDALKIIRELVARGHRWSKAPRREAALKDLERRLKALHLSVERDAFTAKDPGDGSPRPMTNLIGRFRPNAACRVLLGSHFDTRHLAEEDPQLSRRGDPIPGANDGTSGVAVLLTLARRFEELVPKGMGVDLVLFDGEEMGYPDAGGYSLGSAHLARQPALLKRKPKLGIILDMVCDENGEYLVEKNSREAAPDVVSALWSVGARVAPGAFIDRPGFTIGDDHGPLSRAGIPSALVIGFNYPQWHTHADVPERCSAKRLGEVESALAAFLEERAAALARCAP